MLAVNPRLVLLIFLAYGFTIHLTMGSEDSGGVGSRTSGPRIVPPQNVGSGKVPVVDDDDDKRDHQTTTDVRPLNTEQTISGISRITVGEVSYPSWMFGNDLSKFWDYFTVDRLKAGKHGKITIPYELQIADERLKEIVLAALEQWHDATCIDFQEADAALSTSIPYSLLIKDDIPECKFPHDLNKARSTHLILGGKTCQTMSSALKGIGIALGLIPQDMQPRWRKYITYYNDDLSVNDTPTRFFEYLYSSDPIDYGSVALMSWKTSWKPGSLPVEANDIQFQGLIRRNSNQPSHIDKLLINEKYGCLSHWNGECNTSVGYCSGVAYMGGNCECLCPNRKYGPTCDEGGATYNNENLLPRCSRLIEEETTISHPGFPQNVRYDTWCVYRIRVDQEFRIKVRFTNFHLHKEKSDCSEAFLEIRNESFYKLGEVFCGREIQEGQEFRSVGNEMVLYMDVRNKDSRGFRFEVTFYDPDKTTTEKPTPPTTTTAKTGSIPASTSPNIALLYTHHVFLIFSFLWTIVFTQYLQNLGHRVIC